MDDLFKKVINTGVGLLAQGNKRVQTALDKLVQESKLSEQEGQKIMADLRQSGEAKRKQFEKQVQGLASTLRERVGRSDSEQAAPAAPKAKAAPKATTKKPASSPAAKAVQSAADKVNDTAAKTQRSAAAKTGAAKKSAAKDSTAGI